MLSSDCVSLSSQNKIIVPFLHLLQYKLSVPVNKHAARFGWLVLYKKHL